MYPKSESPQEKLGSVEPLEPLTWRFPDLPADEEPDFPPDFQLKTPTPAESVSVTCGENLVRVEAKRDLLGTGRLAEAAEVTLGGCPASREDPEDQVLVFESELHGCGSELQMSEDAFTYIFKLLYSPRPLGDTGIVRGTDVSIDVQCHYPRKQEVSSGLLKPTWIPFTGSRDSEESLHLSLQLMTDDWQFPLPASNFLLGDMMRFEASVKQFHHVPLRVTVDSCVATVAPNIDTVPRYTFLGNSGCLFDSQLTGSSSRFLPRSQDDKLRFEVEVFRFEQDTRGVLYITCNLKAKAAAAPAGDANKACSFINRWTEAGGSHHACSCCDSDCGTGEGGDPTRMGALVERDAVVGPITVKERPLI
ncbi:zona pellucida sperm-binding protein 3-like [Cololabis saira]|uniref:zona pellucida sperm-binding protein 3-like n=1 Tax=Cololabis saira TaxID=129043 RepID=UPI002AD4F364|nr:zona pellucida sperm-binding protein 3-like [Cololabis saira]